MESRIAILGIFVYELDSANKINDLLHKYSRYIIGRMGIPYKDKQVSVMSVIVDGPNDVIGALSGKNRNAQRCQCKGTIFKRIEWVILI